MEKYRGKIDQVARENTRDKGKEHLCAKLFVAWKRKRQAGVKKKKKLLGDDRCSPLFEMAVHLPDYATTNYYRHNNTKKRRKRESVTQMGRKGEKNSFKSNKQKKKKKRKKKKNLAGNKNKP